MGVEKQTTAWLGKKKGNESATWLLPQKKFSIAVRLELFLIHKIEKKIHITLKEWVLSIWVWSDTLENTFPKLGLDF